MKKYHWPRRVLSLLLCLVLAIGFFPAGAIDRAEAATGYVTDNLVLHLDANNNTGSGFDANATTWKNLAAGGEEIKINGQTWGTDETYGSKYLSFSNNYIILPESVRQAIAGENFTVEFIMDDYTASDKNNIINVMCVTGDDAWIKSMTDAGSKGGVVNDNFVLFVTQSTDSKTYTEIKFRSAWWDNGWNIMAKDTSSYARANGTTVNGKTNTLTYDHDGYSYYYLDGVQTSTGASQNMDSKTISLDGFKINGTWQTERKPQVAFGAATDTIKSRSFHGNVKAIRIYKDVLTPEEAAQNAAADKANYYTEQKPATIAVPEGYVTDNLVFFVA